MNDPFQKKIKLIDKNIKQLNSKKLNLKESLKLLKATTNLLSSANDLLLSQHNTISDETNNFLLNGKLEKYYNDLLIRKKIISDFTGKYKFLLKAQKSSNSIITEENMDDDNESSSLLSSDVENNKNNNHVELEFIIDKNETLMKRSNKDLEQIANDMGEIRKNLHGQGKKIEDFGDTADLNERRAKSGDILIKDIVRDENCTKLSLTIINTLLFVLIIAIIIYKAL